MWSNSTLFHQQNLLEKVLRKDKYWHEKFIKVFSTGQNLLIKIDRKDKNWHNKMWKAFW